MSQTETEPICFLSSAFLWQSIHTSGTSDPVPSSHLELPTLVKISHEIGCLINTLIGHYHQFNTPCFSFSPAGGWLGFQRFATVLPCLWCRFGRHLQLVVILFHSDSIHLLSWPVRVTNSCPVWASQTLVVVSRLAATIRLIEVSAWWIHPHPFLFCHPSKPSVQPTHNDPLTCYIIDANANASIRS